MAGLADNQRSVAATQSAKTLTQCVKNAGGQESARREKTAESCALHRTGSAGNRNPMAGGPFAICLRYLG